MDHRREHRSVRRLQPLATRVPGAKPVAAHGLPIVELPTALAATKLQTPSIPPAARDPAIAPPRRSHPSTAAGSPPTVGMLMFRWLARCEPPTGPEVNRVFRVQPDALALRTRGRRQRADNQVPGRTRIRRNAALPPSAPAGRPHERLVRELSRRSLASVSGTQRYSRACQNSSSSLRLSAPSWRRRCCGWASHRGPSS